MPAMQRDRVSLNELTLRRTVTGVIVLVTGSWYLTDYRLGILERNVEKLSTVVVESARVDERLAWRVADMEIALMKAISVYSATRLKI
jgi:hypothetical protein